MKSRCSKHEEKLSAYLDGRLSADEMKQIAAHLEKCPACAELLEKMRRVDDMAAAALPDFDAALMDELTEKIHDRLDKLPATAKSPRETRPRIFPIWYQYAAVAASIAVVFLVGRMAWKESGSPFLNGRTQTFNAITAPPPAADEDSMKEAIAKPKGKRETPQRHEEISPRLSTEQYRQQTTRDTGKIMPEETGAVSTEKKGTDTAPRIAIPSTGEGTLPALTDESQDISIMKQAPKSKSLAAPTETAQEEVELGRIAGRVVDQKTGEPLPGVAVQVEGTRLGARSDEQGEYVIPDVPADTYNLVLSTPGYESVELAEVAVKPEQTAERDMAMKQAALDLGKVIAVTGERKGIEVSETSAVAADAENLPAVSMPPFTVSVDSLNKIYAAMVVERSVLERGAADAQKLHTLQSARPKESASRIRVLEAVLDSLTLTLQKGTAYGALAGLYLRAKANYDLYVAGGQKVHLERAVSLRDQLKELLRGRVEAKEDQTLAQEYLDELESWRLDKKKGVLGADE